MRQRGFITTQILLYIVAGMGVALLLSGLAVWVQTGRLNALQDEYAGFVAEVKAKGEEQERRTQETIERDRKSKESADAQNRKLRAANESLSVSLRDARAHSGYLPAPGAGTGSTDRICFSRPELERTIAELDAGVSSIVGRCDQTRIDLDTARAWTQGR